MKIIRRGKVQKYAFDNRDKPCLRVKQGEVFQVETDDALSGLIADDSDNPLVHPMIGEHVAKLQQSYPPLYNPVVGPIFVDGCEDGDVLAVTIDWIDPWRYGFSGILPGVGPLTDSLSRSDCAKPSVPMKGSSGQERLSEYTAVPSRVWPLGPGRCSITCTLGFAQSLRESESVSGPTPGKIPEKP